MYPLPRKSRQFTSCLHRHTQTLQSNKHKRCVEGVIIAGIKHDTSPLKNTARSFPATKQTEAVKLARSPTRHNKNSRQAVPATAHNNDNKNAIPAYMASSPEDWPRLAEIPGTSSRAVPHPAGQHNPQLLPKKRAHPLKLPW